MRDSEECGFAKFGEKEGQPHRPLQLPKQGSGEGGAEHSSPGSSHRRCGNGSKMHEVRFQLSIKESLP